MPLASHFELQLLEGAILQVGDFIEIDIPAQGPVAAGHYWVMVESVADGIYSSADDSFGVRL